jgi:mannan endo-1,4-beta-mannosidase
MKHLYCIISLFLLFNACKKSTTEYPKLTQPVAKTYEIPKGVFRVDGNKILDSAGNPFTMRGMNFPVYWYPTEYLPSLAAARSLGCNAARLVWNNPLTPKYLKLSVLDTAISNCIKTKMIPIVEIHNINGDASGTIVIDSALALLTSPEFKAIIDKYKAYIILNIANEWGDGYETWRDTYKSAVTKLRAVGYKMPIMIDAPGWGQNSAAIAQYGLDILNTDTCKNIIFSTHAYGKLWDYTQASYGTYETRIDNILKKGLCLVFGE